MSVLQDTVVQDTDDAELLRQFVEKGSQAAFARLVERYVDLVYSAARRQIADSELAADVTQAVFIILAKKAAGLRGDSSSIMAWLLKVTHFAANDARRKRARRMHHEKQAAAMRRDSDAESGSWEEFSPLLDEGIARLRDRDRDVLVMRYFGKKSNREVADELGISEEAAQKRTMRAVEKLRDFFRRNGVAVSCIGLPGILATRSIEAAPAGLGPAIASSAATATTAGGASLGLAKGTVIAMATAKAKIVLASALVALLIIGGGTVAVVSVARHLFWSGAPREVDVGSAASPVAAATNAPTTMPSTPWFATFSDGARIDLLGVSATPGQPAGWWGGDGKPIAAPLPTPQPAAAPQPTPQPGISTRLPLPAHHRYYQIILGQSVTGAAADDISIYFTATSASSSAGWRMYRGGVRRFEITAALPDSLTSLDLNISCARGTMEVDWRYDLQAARTRPATQPAELIVGRVYEEGGRTEVEITYRKDMKQPERESQFEVVRADGRSVGETRERTSPDGLAVLEFQVPLKQAVALVKRSRPVETRQIRNVPLAPAAAGVSQ